MSKDCPAFFVAIAAAIGCALFFSFNITLAVIAIILISFSKKRWLLLATTILFFALAYIRTPPIQTLEKPTPTSGIFKPKRCTHSQNPFFSGYTVYGTLNTTPCSIFFPKNARLPIDGHYQVSGMLRPNHSFKPQKGHKWEKLPKTFSPVGLRHRLKNQLKNHITKKIHHKDSGQFLAALLAGELEDRHMRFYFSKLGLSHLLAISGIHFGLIALILSVFIRRIFAPYLATITLLLILTLYALLLGDSPSVMRAYFMIGLYQIGRQFGLYAPPLNLVGVAALIELLIAPHHITYISFILSYSATSAILLFYPTCTQWLLHIFPDRTSLEIKNLSPFSQIEYCCCNILKKTCAVNLSVHLILIPIILCLFGSFPILSLIYNLFIPPLVSLSLSLLLIALLLGPLGSPIHFFNSHLASFTLELIRYPPQFLNIQLKTDMLTPQVTLVFLAGIFFLHKLKKQTIIYQ